MVLPFEARYRQPREELPGRDGLQDEVAAGDHPRRHRERFPRRRHVRLEALRGRRRGVRDEVLDFARRRGGHHRRRRDRRHARARPDPVDEEIRHDVAHDGRHQEEQGGAKGIRVPRFEWASRRLRR